MAEERRQRGFARTVKLVLFSLTPAIVLVILAETAATVSIARRARILPDSATGGSVYTLRIGRWPWSRPTVTPLNRAGFPDQEFPPRGSKQGCLHVVFAGDSYIFGDGVDRDSAFVDIVRRRSAARRDSRCVRMFNIGERGTTIDKQVQRILETMDVLQPDVVILGQYQNDLTDLTLPGAILGPAPPPPGSPPGSRIVAPSPPLNANLLRLLTYQSMGFMIRNGIKRDELRRWSVLADSSRRREADRLSGAYARMYADLVSALTARGIAFGVVIIPSKLDVLAGRYPEEEFFTGLARRHGVPSLSVFPVLDEKRAPYAFLMYDGHLNKQGNRVVADALFDWLFVTEPPPFPVLRERLPQSLERRTP